ncbi:hypothetical protein C8Q80DRAFT_1122744 [Daedaleopsis nitida]|nr:hypothetical protein C8Q80DRAFT_1122744 [Daedaleopsis nitida]
MMLTPSFTALATILGAGLVANARPWNYGNADSLMARAVTVPGSILHLHTSSLPEFLSTSTAISTPAVSLPKFTTMTSLASATLASPLSTASPHNARGQDDFPDAHSNPPLPGSVNPADSVGSSAPVTITTSMSSLSTPTPSTLPETSSVEVPAVNPTPGTPTLTVTITTSSLPTEGAAIPTDVALTTTTTTSHKSYGTVYPYDPSSKHGRPAYGHTHPYPQNGADSDDGSDWDSDDDDDSDAGGATEGTDDELE